MAHIDSVRILASLFRATNEARPVLLLGAGASFSSGVPVAAESVRRLARRVYADRVKGGSLPPEQVKLSEWQPWLENHPWFIKGDDRLAENFPLVVEHLLTPRDYRRKLLLDILEPSSGIGSGYKRLSDLVLKGLARTILTTNLDACLSLALNERRPHIKHITEVNRSPGELQGFNLFNPAQIVWLHGRPEQYTDRSLVDEVEKLDASLIKHLVPLLRSSPLIVIGYRGSEPSVMEDLLIKNVTETQRYRHGVYWCNLAGEPPHANVEALRRAVTSNFQFLEISGFDELMEDLAHELVNEDLYYQTNRAEPAKAHPHFDDTAVADASFDDLDRDLILATMRDYCAKLGRAPVTHDTLPALLREQGLLTLSGGQEKPTAGCLLLFGKDPQRHFPHAVVTVAIKGKKRLVFSGNLVRQRKELIDWLETEEINPVIQVKRRTDHEERMAFPTRGLVELLVNMLVHRDYEIDECASIDVDGAGSITFSNPGGLLNSIAHRLQLDHDGRFRPMPNVSELRNSALCDVFFGIRAMERAGTGLSDVEKMARDLGGDATFVHDGKARRFIAKIQQPAASAGSRSIARDDRPVGVYVFNFLPFVSLPARVSVLRLANSSGVSWANVPLHEAGTFVHRGEFLWSFSPLEIVENIFASIGAPKGGQSYQREDLEADSDDRKVLSWLVRKHFEHHLKRYEHHGLMLELGKRRINRAYFAGRDGRPRNHVYNTPNRKNVQRQVVKQRGEGVKAWFENEGFGYEVIQLDGRWGIRIKPFYMFTQRDGFTPLPSFARTARATRRMKYDRNRNVDDDLTFWSRFLSAGGTTINIGNEHVEDLILDGTFFTIEVVEEGLTRENDEGQNRVSA